MSTLAYTNSNLASAEANPAQKEPRKGFWRRLFEALVAAQQRRAEREIAAYLRSHGGIMTDDSEREIMRRLSGDRRHSV